MHNKKELEKKTNEDLVTIAKKDHGLNFPEEYLKEDMVASILYAQSQPPLPDPEKAMIEQIPKADSMQPIPLGNAAVPTPVHSAPKDAAPAGRKVSVVIGSSPADFQKDRNDAFNVWDLIYINETEKKKDNFPVFCSVNGRSITIPRGIQIAVRRPYVEVLKNAVYTTYDPETMEETHSPRFAFQVIQNDVS